MTKNPLRGGLSLSWSQGAPGRLAVGTVDGSVCVFDIHRCMQYDIENNVSYSKSSNEKHFAHVPTITVTMEEAGPIRDLEFAPLEDEDENREDEKSVEDDIKRKRLASANFIAVAAHKVSKANVIDLRSRSVLPESFQIEKWMDDIRSVAWLPKGAYIYGCDGTVGFNGKFLLRQYDGLICWEDDEQEVRYGGTVGIKLPAADDILKDIKKRHEQRRHRLYEKIWRYALVHRFAHFWNSRFTQQVLVCRRRIKFWRCFCFCAAIPDERVQE